MDIITKAKLNANLFIGGLKNGMYGITPVKCACLVALGMIVAGVLVAFVGFWAAALVWAIFGIGIGVVEAIQRKAGVKPVPFSQQATEHEIVMEQEAIRSMVSPADAEGFHHIA